MDSWVPQTDHREASTMVRRQDVGDSRGGGSAVSSGNVVGDDLYGEMAVNHGTVGGVTTTI